MENVKRISVDERGRQSIKTGGSTLTPKICCKTPSVEQEHAERISNRGNINFFSAFSIQYPPGTRYIKYCMGPGNTLILTLFFEEFK